jgi:cytochrome P450 family 6|uniref:Cytochrome P450 monooxygenase CYP6BK19 n=1 Tax=Tenebrio molitor TaxID=7067 RepID=A0A0K1YWE3_TENMO|nr:cytochrome P450 monooxygenase CYP6BK19 [Tenebrio molitor]
MFVSESLIKDLIGVAVALVVVLIGYYKWSFTYWKRKNLPYVEPSIPFGNLSSPLKGKESMGMAMFRLYNEMKHNKWKHGGIYFLARPMYYVIDPDYIKNVMATDFHHFVDRGLYYNEKADPLSAHLFTIGGAKWRNLRMKLTPTFTSGKMKMMFQTLVDCEAGLQARIEQECQQKEPIDIKEVLACFTTDVIGSCAFGLDCHTFKEENSPFRIYSKKVLNISAIEMLKRMVAFSFPDMATALSVTLTPKDVESFFMKVVKDTVKYREEKDVQRKDFMQLLIDLKNNKLAEEDGYKHDGRTLTVEEIAAQSVVFFVAGFETSSTTMSFALYELAKNQDIQEKVREEVKSVLAKYDGKITYEAIHDMKYMDLVLSETLRKYPPVTFLTRQCVLDYKVPNEDVIIEKGTTVSIPILGLHYDEEYYPDPKKFDPERFTEENQSSRPHFTYMPFGEGPRMCIGMRFGLMQSKVGLASLLRNHNFTVNKKTMEPLKMKPNSFIFAVEGEIWLNAQKV